MESAVAVPGLDVHVYSRPYHDEAAGGDVLYVSSCGTGRIARILVADVAGHGEKVADIARVLRDLMRRFINYVDQTAFVFALNRAFAAAATDGRFATAVAATYWSATDCLTATNAGHPRPVWYCAERGAWKILKDDDDPAGEPVSANLPLGVIDLTEYDHITVRIAPGDVVLFYTDSIIEAREPGGQMLGERGLVQMLGDLDAKRPQDLVRQLVDRVAAFRGGQEPDDDLTVLAMVCTGQKPPRPVREKMRSSTLFARALIARLRDGRTPVPWPEVSVVNMLGAFIRPINRRWGGRLREGEVRTGAAARRPR
ncbi:MAG: serine/threonine-protein phosphatase [Phycisphaerales bacterium]|nr:serine/threonine-protein phosphatase [Phycisphaerales bacterium]